MENVNYADLLPDSPNKEIIPWLKEHGAFRQELLTYRADTYIHPLTEEKQKCVRATCSACHQTMLLDYVPNDCCHAAYAPAPFGFFQPELNDRVISGNHTLCPNCGAEVEAVHIGHMRSPRCYDAYPMTVERVGDRLALCGWCVRRVIDKDASTRYETWPYEAYVVEQKKIIRLTGYLKCITTIKLLGHWEQRKRYSDIWGNTDLTFPWDPSLLEGSTAENSKLDIYLKEAKEAWPVSYLKLWQKHRNLENLVVQGAGKLVGDMIHTSCHRYGYESPRAMPQLHQINWKEKRPAQMLGLNKEEFRYCRAQMWSSLDLSFYKECRDGGTRIKLPGDMATVINVGVIDALEILHVAKTPLMKTLRYLEKQKQRQESLESTGTIRSIHASDLRDYWKMAAEIGMNLEAESVLWPKDLAAAHDRVMQEQKNRREKDRQNKLKKEMAARKKKFAARKKQLESYAWESGGLMIRVCATETELINEGNALNHCVARYAEDHANGKTAIFFVREKTATRKSFFTLELNEADLTVRQNRGAHNRDRTAEVDKFEHAWLKWLKTERRKAEKKSKKKEAHAA